MRKSKEMESIAKAMLASEHPDNLKDAIIQRVCTDQQVSAAEWRVLCGLAFETSSYDPLDSFLSRRRKRGRRQCLADFHSSSPSKDFLGNFLSE